MLFENWRKFIKESNKSEIVDEAMADYIPGTSSRKMKQAVEREEDPSKELNHWMNQRLKDLPTPPIADLSPGALALIKKGAVDGSKTDDIRLKAGISGDISFAKLKASQNEIGSKQSLRNTMAGVDGTEWDGIDWGDPQWLIKQMQGTPTFTFKNPIVVAKTSDGFVILDGHHRWSQAMMINPKGKINVVGFSAPGMTSDDVLQALHLGIYTVADQAKIKPAEGTNLLSGGAAQIRDYMATSERKVNPQTLELDPNGVPPYVAVVMKLQGITDPNKGTAVAEAYAKKAIAAMAASVVSGAPPRTKMPQTDIEVNPGATPDAVAKKLAMGIVNYAPPYGEVGASTDMQPAGGRSQKRVAESNTPHNYKIKILVNK